MQKIIIGTALLLSVTTGAMAQQGIAGVNGYTPAQRAAAEAAVKAAGFTPGAISYAQGGAIFINGEKGGERFLITVTADGKVFASTAAKPFVTAPAAPAAATR